jgi:hypothetical protein
MIIPSVGDTVNVLINPGHTPTTATVVSVDALRHQVVLTHLNGVLTNRTVTMHLDHVRTQGDFQAPRCIPPLWV